MKILVGLIIFLAHVIILVWCLFKMTKAQGRLADLRIKAQREARKERLRRLNLS